MKDQHFQQAAEFYSGCAKANGFAFVLEAAARAIDERPEEELPPAQSLLDLAGEEEKRVDCTLGVCAKASTALRLKLTPELRSLLEDAAVLKRTHDLKLALHLLEAQDVVLRGVAEDTMLLSYALNPTHTTQALADVAGRHGQTSPATQAASGAVVFALVPVLERAARESEVERVYREIDLPLAPVLYHMEKVGVRIDTGVLDGLSKRFGVELERVGERIFELAGRRFNINSPKQLGEVLFTHMGLSAPNVRGKGKSLSTAQDVLEQLAEQNEVPKLVLEYRHLSKLKSNYVEALPSWPTGIRACIRPFSRQPRPRADYRQ